MPRGLQDAAMHFFPQLQGAILEPAPVVPLTIHIGRVDGAYKHNSELKSHYPNHRLVHWI